MSESASAIPFDLRALEVFLAVCDTGGMAHAARRLGVTQPAVSQTIAEIEARTGTTLFDRRTRPLSLTSAGLVLRQRGSLLLADAREIGPLLRQIGQRRVPFLRVGVVDSLSRALADLVAGFLAEVADQSTLLSGLTISQTSSLVTRQLDIFLGAQEVEDTEGLERHVLHEEPYILVCKAGVPAPGTVAEMAALAPQSPFLRFNARSRMGLEIERHLRRLRLDLPRRQEFDSTYAVAAAIASGLGWTIATPLCVREAALPAGLIDCHPLPGPLAIRRLVLVAQPREFGPLPAQLATLCRLRLREGGPPAFDAKPLR